MNLHHPNGFIWVPSGISTEEALSRTTHLSIGAHPDDLEFMSLHGISQCYEKRDRFFTGVVVTDGGGSVKSGPYAGMEPDEMRQLRIEEQKKAAQIGKFNALIMLQYPSKDIQTLMPFHKRYWLRDIASLLLIKTPEILYSQNPFDKHPTHLAVILPLIQLLQSLKNKPSKFYGCEGWRGLDWLLEEDRMELPLNGAEGLAEEINQVFVSQFGAGKNYIESVRGRRIANATYTDPHTVDPATQLELAVDLTGILNKETKDIVPFLQGFLDRFKNRLMNEIETRVVA